jgi:hypothetical protein
MSALIWDSKSQAWQEPDTVPLAWDGEACVETTGYAHNGSEWEEVWSSVRIPDDYQEVAYLESTGKQRINTNMLLNATNDSVVIRYAFTGNPSSNFIWGSGNSANSYGNKTAIKSLNSKIYHTYNDGGSTGSILIPYDTDWHLAEFNFASNKMIVDDNINKMEGKSVCTSSTYKVHLFCYYAAVCEYIYGYAKISQYFVVRSGNRIIDLVPCYRKSDKVAGMYDMVSGNFLTNSGTGTFIVGEKV